MALINCPECGTPISSLATACPHCGYPIKADQPCAPCPQSASKPCLTKATRLNTETSPTTASSKNTSQKNAGLVIIVIVFFIFASIVGSQGNSNASTPEPVPLENKVEEKTVPIHVDYLDVLLYSEKYHGKHIQVAGEISSISQSELRFTQGIGYLDAPLDFSMEIMGKPILSETYGAGDYVVVEGMWNHSSSVYSKLTDGIVVTDGVDAEKTASEYESQWALDRLAQASTIESVSYMEISNNPQAYDGQYVRIAGKVSSIGRNVASKHLFFSFRDTETNSYACSISLKGCSSKIQSSIIEDEYVVVTGQVVADSNFSLIDCNVESIGDEAKLVTQSLFDGFYTDFKAERQAFISGCKAYDYQNQALYPDENKGQAYSLSGTVLQTETISGDYIVLLDIGNGDTVYVEYSGKRHSDANILVGSYIQFYGLASGSKTYVTILGNTNTVPYFQAIYSDINDYS